MVVFREWSNILANLEQKVSSAAVKTWFHKTELLKISEASFEISFPNTLALERTNNHYLTDLKEVLCQALGLREINLTLTVKKRGEFPLGPLFGKTEEPGPSVDIVKNTVFEKEVVFEQREVPSPTLKSIAFGLSPFYTFEEYIVGPGNQLAFSIAKNIAQNPGRAYNPFFLYAATGLGKTHLLQAIGNEIISRYPNKKVVYASGETFTNELLEAIQHRTQRRFREKFRQTDVLLIDDIQFIAGKEATQEEFFHAFNELYLAQKQVALASDRPPKDIALLSERLKSRFAGGMMADIQIPDLNVRTAVLRNKRDRGGFEVSNEVLDFLAEQLKTNIREMEGILLQVVSVAKTRDTEASIELSSEILAQNSLLNNKQKPTPKKIIEEVCQLFNISHKDLVGPRRKKELVFPRQICMYLLRNIAQLPLMTIGQTLGGRDHTTIMHGVAKIEKNLESEEISQRINFLTLRVCG